MIFIPLWTSSIPFFSGELNICVQESYKSPNNLSRVTKFIFSVPRNLFSAGNFVFLLLLLYISFDSLTCMRTERDEMRR
jgi:hypothetical protein